MMHKVLRFSFILSSCVLLFVAGFVVSGHKDLLPKASKQGDVLPKSNFFKSLDNAGQVPFFHRSALGNDTLGSGWNKYLLGSSFADNEFTYENYAWFLSQVSDTSRYIVVPINEFRRVHDKNKVVIGLRHDVDVDLNKAFGFSQTERQLGFRSTYYILHTASYYLQDALDVSKHNPAILPTLKTMQDEYGFEIGWHNDLVTLQVVYGLDPVIFLHQELKWLRENGLRISGSSSHGSNYCYTYHYTILR